MNTAFFKNPIYRIHFCCFCCLRKFTQEWLLIKLLTLFITGLCIPMELSSQEKFNFRHITSDDGLSSNTIKQVVRDDYGYLWAIANKINRFNGNIIEILESSDQKFGLKGVRFDFLFKDISGDIWISSDIGLNRYLKEYNGFEQFSRVREHNETSDLYNTFIVSMTNDADTNLLMNLNYRLYRLSRNDSIITPFAFPDDELNQLKLRTLYRAANGIVWVTFIDYGYVVSFNTKTNQVIKHVLPEIKSNPSAFLNHYFGESPDGKTLYISDLSSYFYVIDKATFNVESYGQRPDGTGLNSKQSGHISVGSNGKVYIVAPSGGGLQVFDPREKRFQYVMHDPDDPSTLNSDNNYYVYFDNKGLLYIASVFSGISIHDFNLKSFYSYRRQSWNSNSLGNNLVTFIYEDRSENIWLGTEGGLNLFNQRSENFLHYVHDPKDPSSIPDNAVLSMIEDHDNDLWIGTWNAGLLNYSLLTGQFKTFRHNPDNPEGLASNKISKLAVDRDGFLWIGYSWNNSASFARFDKKTGSIKNFGVVQENQNSPRRNMTEAMMISKDNKLYIGFHDNGILVCNPKDFSMRRNEEAQVRAGISNSSILTFFHDSKNRVWLGSRDKGLILYNPINWEFKAYSRNEGLPDENVLSINEDVDGNLWLGTTKGLVCFNPETEKIITYTREDGIQGNEFKSGATARLRSGQLIFGGVNGFTVFNPTEIKDNPHIPPVEIIRFSISGKPVSYLDRKSPLKKHISTTERIVLAHHQSNISFEFIALNFTNFSKNQYKYKLEHFDNDWVESGNRREAFYTNLKPGRYNFRVIASNNDGVWNEEGASLAIRVKAPFWATWWFYLLVVLAIAGAIRAFIKMRESALRHDKQQLEESLKKGKQELQDKLEKIDAQRIAIEEKEKAEALVKWMNAGIAQFSELINQSKDNMAEMFRKLINELISYVEAGLGGIYMYTDPEDGQEPYLEMAGYYAPDEIKIEQVKIMPGEGNIGTAFLEKRAIIIENLPKGYAKITSGLGETHLRYLAIIPIQFDNVMAGVFEILAIELLSKEKVEFIERIGEMLAVNLITNKANMKANKVIEEMLRKNEMMAAQDEELRQNLEEMSATQEELQRQQEKNRTTFEQVEEKEIKYQQEISKLKREISQLKKASK